MRRCVSYSDLASARRFERSKEAAAADFELSDLGNSKPLKRSRSDQSLADGVQSLICTADARTSQLGLVRHPISSTSNQGSQRVQRFPSLPVVLSDIGSSTSSLLSLDTDVPRSASQQQLLQQTSSKVPAVAFAGGLATTPDLESPAAQQQQYPLSPSEADLVSAFNKRSYGALYSLANVSSVASLTQYAYTGGGTLERTASDASVSSAGGQSYLAHLQQLVPPLPPYSPPPLFSPGPSLTASASNLLASPRDHGTGWFGNISSILQQKQAVFKAPAAAAQGNSISSTGPAAARRGVPGQRLGIPSIDSTDSITSVEAGEHLLGFAYTVPGGSPRVMPQAGAGRKLGTAATDSASTGSQQPPGQLWEHASVKPTQEQQPSAGQQQAVGAAASESARAAPAVGAANGLPANAAVPPSKPPKGDASGLAVRQHSSNSGPQQQQQQQQGRQSVGSLVSPSHSRHSGPLELQTVSSMLGCEGEQLLLLPEHSTGAIDSFDKGNLLGFTHAAAEAPAAAAMQMSANVTASTQSAICSSQQQSLRVRTKGGHNSLQQAPPVTSPGAARDSSAASALVPVILPNALLGTAHSMSTAFNHTSTAAPAGQGARIFGFRQTNSVTGIGAAGTGHAVQGAAAAAAAAAAAQAFAPAWRHASVSWPAANSSSAATSAPLPSPQPEGQQQHGSLVPASRISAMQSCIARQGMSSWSLTRRPASFDCGRPLSSRRRGSLELNMPWRTKLDAVIAQVTADALESPVPAAIAAQQPGSSPCSGIFTSATAAKAARQDDDDADITLRDDPFSSFAAMEPVIMAMRQHGSRSMLQQHGSSALLPLLESDQEQHGAATTAADTDDEVADAEGTASPVEALSSDWQQSADSTANSSNTSGAGTSGTFSSISSDAAPYHLAAGSMVGGYVGASDMARGTSASLSELETARSYGLEFDGAVVMQNVELSSVGPQWSEGMELLAGVHLQQQEQQQSDAGAAAERQEVSEDTLEDVQALSQQQQQELASLGSPSVESRLRFGPASRKQPDHADDAEQHIQPPMVNSHHPVHKADCSKQQQPEEQPKQLDTASQQSGFADAAVCPAEQQISPGALPDMLHQLASGGSFSSSVSSISNRSSAGIYGRRGAGSSSSSAAYELFVRLNRARQTLDFAKRQAELFAELDCAELGVWEALDLLNGMREYEAVLLSGFKGTGRSSSSSGGEYSESGAIGGPRSSFSDGDVTPDMPLKEHALQVAELCRLSFPDKPWMALVGLLHGLGKLLAHPIFSSQPQWAVAGESYPLGCKFAPQISHSEFFSANPDRRRRAYSSALGIYTAGCGLRNVYMSWGAPEYLYMLLVLNQTDLPEEALFMIRYQRCLALTRPGGAYRQLMSEMDKSLLPLLAAFQGLIAYKRVQLPSEALQGDQLITYYDKLIAQYLGEEKLFW